MTGGLRIAATLASLVFLGAAYRIPPEQPVNLGNGQEAQLIRVNCMACHSLDYITHQPPAMGRGFWEAEVTKMRTVYGAEIDDENAARIAAYLATATAQ